jgi:hypothetical protein
MLKTYICPCGAMKSAAHVFCNGCWNKLPLKVRAEIIERRFARAAEALGWQ